MSVNKKTSSQLSEKDVNIYLLMRDGKDPELLRKVDLKVDLTVEERQKLAKQVGDQNFMAFYKVIEEKTKEYKEYKGSDNKQPQSEVASDDQQQAQLKK